MSRAAVAGVEVEAEAPAQNGVSGVIRFLTREDILAKDDLPTETVWVPEWETHVIVRGMTGTDRDSFERAMLDMRGDNAQVNWKNFRSKLICRCLVDGEGKRLFKDEDAEALGRKSAAALNRLFEVCNRLSGMTETDVEELTTGLKEAPSADSGSA